ncbi:LOW QUALITY PROTEIN: cilia- and flagella-associated protein 44-like [Tautogolabrus adspersus]
MYRKDEKDGAGGFDAGFLYHCKFSENQDQEPDQHQDEPFDFQPVHNADKDPICSITFSSDRQLLLCGMHSGFIRIYLLQPGDHSLTSLQAYWTLSCHDNQYGHLRHICCSHDDHFVLTAGDDGNIFSFSLLPPEELQKELQRKRAKVPSPRVSGSILCKCIGFFSLVSFFSIETAKQKLEKDRVHREAELYVAAKRKKLAELRKKFEQVLKVNNSLPEHVRLTPEELQLSPRFAEHIERVTAERVREVRKQMSWEQERCSIKLSKLQDWFKDSVVVTVVAICSEHRVSTYSLPALTETSAQVVHQSRASPPKEEQNSVQGCRKSKAEPANNGSILEEEEMLHPPVSRPARIKLTDRQVERLRKTAEKAEQARAKIEKRRQEWAKLYAEKPDENFEDPHDVQAIKEAKEAIGDKMKSDKDFKVPKNLMMNAEKKRAELMGLVDNIRQKQTEMNSKIVALRDSKVRLLSQLRAQAERVKKVQQRLPAHLHRPPPTLPTMQPEETPEKRLQFSQAKLERYHVLRDQRLQTMGQYDATSLLDQLEKEEDNEKNGEERTSSLSASSASSVTGDKTAGGEGAKRTEREEELQKEEELRLLYEQDSLLEEYQELLLVNEFEKREDSLQEKLKAHIKEENNIMSMLKDFNEQLAMKQADIARLQEREKALFSAFQASLGLENKFEEFLTEVFKKKIKRVKKKEQTEEEEEEESDDDSDEDYDDDDDHSSSEEEGALDSSVCPPGCEPELLENTLQLRERRLDLEKLVMEEKKIAKALRRECDTLVKKEKSMKSSRKAAEEDLKLVYREKQQKMDELHVVVPLRLNQIEFLTNGSVPSDLSPALVLDRTELNRLQEQIKQLQVEKNHQRDLTCAARQQHIRLLHESKDMNTKIQMLEKDCNQMMMKKYGKLVDLDILQTLPGNRILEELKQEKLLKEAAYAKELSLCVKVEEARDHLNEVTRRNTECLRRMSSLISQETELERKINKRQKKMGRQFQDDRRSVVQKDIQRLKDLVKTQSQEAEALRREIFVLSHQGGHVLPPGQDPLPSLDPNP